MTRKILLSGIVLLLAVQGISQQATIKTAQYLVLLKIVYKSGSVPFNYRTKITGYTANYGSKTFYSQGGYLSYPVDTIGVYSEEDYPALIHIRAEYQEQRPGQCIPPSPLCPPQWWTRTDILTAIPTEYPEFDTIVNMAGSSTYVDRIEIRIVPNYEVSYNLPSHDHTSMALKDVNTFPPYTWEFQEEGSTNWTALTNSQFSGSTIRVGGMNLFGDNYINYLNQTVKFRVWYSATDGGPQDQVSKIALFTHRLSAPHVTSITPVHNPCYGDAQGSLRIQFDRALLPGERINLLLKDTGSFSDYAAFNITALDAQNAYTWASQLPAGGYYLSMLGKYPRSLPADLSYSYRDVSIGEYRAQNSITFTEGFESAVNDVFTANIYPEGEMVATYTGSRTHFGFSTVTQPPVLQFSTESKQDVYCKGGSSGQFVLSAKGGNGNYRYGLQREGDNTVNWVNFSGNTADPFGFVKQTIPGLMAGTYHVFLRDANNCQLKDSLGNEIFATVIIHEPAQALGVELLETTPVTTHTAADGTIRIRLTGGTRFNTNDLQGATDYTVEWRDSATNTVISSYILDTIGDKFEMRLNNLPPGTYILTATDANYNTSAGIDGAEGCKLIIKIPMIRPDPLLVNIEVFKNIQCNGESTGELRALATGGHWIDSIRYHYQWYRMNGTAAVPVGTDSAAIGDVSAGQYHVTITDKYNNSVTSQLFDVLQPPAIQVTAGATQASCYSNADGSVSASASGGAGAYQYEWSTGHTTPVVNNLPGGTYIIVVKDSNYCTGITQVSITSPIQVKAQPLVKKVTCNNQCDGEIRLTPTGGAPPYTYQWSNGNTTANALNLCAGTYWYKVSDANGCFDTDTFELENPPVFTLLADDDRKICINHSIRLRAVTNQDMVAYNWQYNTGTIANTDTVRVTSAGTYYITATSSSGCVLKDTVILTFQNSSIHTDFIVASQAFAQENTVLVNLSSPAQDSVKWIVPVANTSLIQQNNNYCEVRFDQPGEYRVTMKVYYSSGCIDEITKKVIVVQKETFVGAGGQADAFLKHFDIYPNPNTGQFTADLLFSSVTRARLRLINILNNMVVDDRRIEGQASYLLNYNIGAYAGGTYVLVIETLKGNFVHKVIKL